MLEQAYNSVSIAGKIPFSEENLQKVIDDYSSGNSDHYKITPSDNSIEVTCPAQPFELISFINTKLDMRQSGYKFIDGSLIIPL